MMKKNWLTILLTLLSMISIGAQEKNSNKLLKEGKVWNYECSYRDWDEDGNLCSKKFVYNEWICGDTVIADRKYYVMKSSTPDIPVSTATFWREDEGKVYVHNEAKDVDELMYDFGLVVGETIDDNRFYGVKATRVDTINIRNTKRRCITLLMPELGDTVYWIEGIGSLYLLAEPLGHPFSDGKITSLVSCYEFGECIFTADDFTEPANTTDMKKVGNKFKDKPLFDMLRVLPTKPQKGLYIQNGKKMIVK